MRFPAFSRAFWWIVVGCGLFFVAVVTRLPLLHHAFALDDFKIIVANDFLVSARNALILFDPRYLFHPYPIICGARPITVFSLLVDYHFWHLNPFGYHLSNIIIHALNTVMVFVGAGLCAKRFAAHYTHGQRWILALTAGCVFCFHPLQTEAVAIASFRGDLLSTFFSLSAVGLFITVFGGLIRARIIIGFVVSAGCLIFGLLSKETAVTVPLVMIMAVLFSRGKFPPRAVIRFSFVCVAIAITYLFVFWRIRIEYPLASSAYPTLVGIQSPLSSFAGYINIVINAWIHHWAVIVAPWHLSVDYQMLIPDSIQFGRLFVAGGIVIILAGILWRTRSKLLSFGIGWFIITYLPVSNIIPLINTVNDRYLYLPMVGIALVVGVMAAQLYALRPSIAIAAAAGLIGWYGVATFSRQPVFATDYALYAAAVARSPENIRVRYNRGISLMVHNDFANALTEFSQVMRLNPRYKRPLVVRSIIDCYREQGIAVPAKFEGN